MRWRLKMLVLCETLVGSQRPETLLKDDFLITLVVVKTLPFFAQPCSDDTGASALHLC
jgi:hypothetical protein